MNPLRYAAARWLGAVRITTPRRSHEKPGGEWAECPVCGDKTRSPIKAALWHFRPIDLEHRAFWRGTRKQFGFIAALCLASPLANILIHWRHRRSKLDL